MAALKRVSDEIILIKVVVTKLMSSVKKLRKYHLAEIAQTRQQEIEMKLLKVQEKNLDSNLASVKTELAGVKVENASRRWSRGNIDDEIEELEADVGSGLKEVAESAQKYVTKLRSRSMPLFLSTESS